MKITFFGVDVEITDDEVYCNDKIIKEIIESFCETGLTDGPHNGHISILKEIFKENVELISTDDDEVY